MDDGNRNPRREESVEAALARISRPQFGAFARLQAREAGVSDAALLRRVKAGRLEKLNQKVFRLPGYPTSWEQQAWAAVLTVGGDVALSHGSAAALHGLFGFERDVKECIEVSSTRAPNPTRMFDHCRTTIWDRVDLTTREGLLVTTIPRTLFDLGRNRSAEEIEIALDCALSRGRTSWHSLMRAAERLCVPGRIGCGVLRDLLRERAPDEIAPRSPAETLFARFARSHKLPRPEAQWPVDIPGGSRRYIDFAYPLMKIAIEVDSFRHHIGRVAWQEDLHRRNELVQLGWRVLHFTWRDLRERPGWVAEVIRATLVGDDTVFRLLYRQELG